MLIKPTPRLRYFDVTDGRLYLNRREFVAAASGAALAAAGAVTPGWLARDVHAQTPLAASPSRLSTDEKPNSFDDITSYNNFYEFGTDKEDPARYAGEMTTTPWTIRVEGHIGVPEAEYALEDILKPFDFVPNERVYRPHITVARRARSFTEVPLARPLDLEWSSFELVESVPTTRGVQYHPIKQ